MFPSENQLFARNKVTNQADVAVAGTASPETELVRLEVYQDDILYEIQLHDVALDGPTYDFLQVIDAGLFEYRFELFESSPGVETLARSSDNVLAGDAYIVQGQSNAVARSRWGSNIDGVDLAFARTFGDPPGHTGPIAPGLWRVPATTSLDEVGFVGQLGALVASKLVASQEIPIAVMTGAEGGHTIDHYLRDPANPTSTTTNYGHLLSRIQAAGFADISGIIWIHGESVQLPLTSYAGLFAELVKAWRQDYPGDYPIYASQKAMLQSPFTNLEQILFRDHVRSLSAIPDVEVFALNAVHDPNSEDGLHYSASGYDQIATLISRMAERDVYNAPHGPTASSADLVSLTCEESDSCRFLRLSFNTAANLETGVTRNNLHYRLSGCDSDVEVRRQIVTSTHEVTLRLNRDAAENGCLGLSYIGPPIAQAAMLTDEDGVGVLSFSEALFPVESKGVCAGQEVTVAVAAGDSPTSGPDVILGTPGADVISGLGGDDTICALGGDDTIAGNGGNDTIFGGEGLDTIYGGAQGDTIHGGPDADSIQGNDGADILHGDDGEDTLSGNDGDDTLFGGADNDFLYGVAGADIINGDGGNDTILGGLHDDIIAGGTENDLISGNTGSDTINGGDGDDNIYGVDGADTLNGNGGIDLILGGNGDDIIAGGTENDLISGNADNDTIDGGGGNDEIYGVGGEDILTGGAGADIILGGSNDDTINTDGDGSVDQVSGNAGTDTCNADTGPVTFDNVFQCENP